MTFFTLTLFSVKWQIEIWKNTLLNLDEYTQYL